MSTSAAVMASSAAATTAASNNQEELKRKKAAMLLIVQEHNPMKKETLLPYVGKKIVVKDMFGASKKGFLKEVGEDSIVLVKDVNFACDEIIVATQYVFSIRVVNK